MTRERRPGMTKAAHKDDKPECTGRQFGYMVVHEHSAGLCGRAIGRPRCEILVTTPTAAAQALRTLPVGGVVKLHVGRRSGAPS